MSKIKFQNQWSSTTVYIISEKDIDDLDYIIQYEDFFIDDDEENGFVNDTMRLLYEYSSPETWDAKSFVELYRKYDENNWYCEVVY